ACLALSQPPIFQMAATFFLADWKRLCSMKRPCSSTTCRQCLTLIPTLEGRQRAQEFSRFIEEKNSDKEYLARANECLKESVPLGPMSLPQSLTKSEFFGQKRDACSRASEEAPRPERLSRFDRREISGVSDVTKSAEDASIRPSCSSVLIQEGI